MNETFNSIIVNARSKLFIIMPNENRLYMMKMWATKKLKVTTL